MGQVFSLTLVNVSKLIIYIALGYAFSHSKRFPKDTSKVLSTITTMLFYPAYSIRNLAQNFTVEKVGEKALLLAFGLLCLVLVFALACLLGKLFGRTHIELRTLTYAFTIPNYAYFGFPIIESVFGPELLADVIVFTLPFSIMNNTFGYWLITSSAGISWKKTLSAPVLWAPLIGITLGLSGLQLPAMCSDLLAACGSCMSPVSMLLVGFVLGHIKIRQLLSSGRAYLLSAVRLLLIPALFGVVMFFCGLRESFLLIPLVVLSMPIAVNTVVFPESCGVDTTDNAKLVFISYILALAVLPLSFSLISYLAFL